MPDDQYVNEECAPAPVKPRHTRAKRLPCPKPEKHEYRDRQEALYGAKRVARNIIANGRHFEPLYGYECPCRRWHLTRRSIFYGQPNVHLWTVPEELQEWAQTELEPANA